MTRDELQQRYAGLCQELGHLTNNKKKLEARLAIVEAAINEVDLAAEKLAQEEQKAAQEVQSADIVQAPTEVAP